MPTPTPDLPPDYYLRNFETVVDFVGRVYGDLLHAHERAVLQAFAQCSHGARCLFVRLVMRKGTLFRRDQLDYDEIHDLDAAATELAQRGLIAVDTHHAIDDLLNLLRKPELAQLTGKPASWKRERLLQQARELDAGIVAAFIHTTTPLITLHHRDIIELLTLCFFANTRQTLTDFVISDLGIMRYERYAIDASTRFFTQRSEIDHYLHYTRLRDIFELDAGACDVVELLQQLPFSSHHAPLNRRVHKFATHLLRETERRLPPNEALALYVRYPQPATRERTARLYAKLGQPEQAWLLCEDIAMQPLHDGDAEFARAFSTRLARTLQRAPLLQEQIYAPPQRVVMAARDDEAVELICARALRDEGDVFYVENALFLALFGIIYWDVIFAPAPAAFVNPYQLGPKDIYERDFLRTRQNIFAQSQSRFASTDTLLNHAMDTFQRKHGIDNLFVNWQWLEASLLQRALEHIPVAHLQAIFARLWADLEQHRSGLPDLILFTDSSYRLIEVKGPGDALQRNQLAWMRYFAQHGIAHEVAWLRYRSDTGDTPT